MKKISFISLVAFLLLVPGIFAQNNSVNVGIVGEKFSDFTLQTYQGEKFSTGDLKGKNILLISSRGRYNDQYWCGICSYQYIDFVNLDMSEKIREKYNLEIAFLMPYDKETLDEWEKSIPGALQYIEGVKNPEDTNALSEDRKNWMNFARKHFAKKYEYPEGKIPLTIPVLIDENQEVSKGLDIFRTEWDGTNIMQNVPTVYIIDKEGILRFKYVSQNTADRPDSRYILKILESIQ